MDCTRSRDTVTSFHHEAFAFRGEEQFRAVVSAYVRAGISAGEAVLVAMAEGGIAALRAELGPAAEGVRFLDIGRIGRNPARIIPLWRDWIEENAGHRPFRGVGEPVWSGRSAAEIVECHQHESLLNLAFDGAPAWRLLCPYDTEHLDASVVDGARDSHPFLQGTPNAGYGPRSALTCLSQGLPEPVGHPLVFTFDRGGVSLIREAVAVEASEAGMAPEAVEDLALAVHEAAVNSTDHGGGSGKVLLWQESGSFICEVRDEGLITNPLVGRRKPSLDQMRGRGMWMVNQLCDLVQVRSSAALGTVVRLHMALP
jgi:anti-sigma regulatory factor (Ser/Thr protein kinase)